MWILESCRWSSWPPKSFWRPSNRPTPSTESTNSQESKQPYHIYQSDTTCSRSPLSYISIISWITHWNNNDGSTMLPIVRSCRRCSVDTSREWYDVGPIEQRRSNQGSHHRKWFRTTLASGYGTQDQKARREYPFDVGPSRKFDRYHICSVLALAHSLWAFFLIIFIYLTQTVDGCFFHWNKSKDQDSL